MRVEQIGNATQVSIYALCEESGEPRYVGKTAGYVVDRHKAHISAARAGRKAHLPVYRWLRKRLSEGARLCVRVLEFVPPEVDWAERERHWIAQYRMGGRLLNVTDGGEGQAGIVWPTARREKVAAKLRTGATFNCLICRTAFWRKRVEINRGDCLYCSKACYQASLRGVTKAVSPECTSAGVAAAAAAKRAKTTCVRGHQFSADNTRINSKGARVCRECQRMHKLSHLQRSANG